ncbi:hypothetical protein HID58_033858 [Brassica napus]|uniref:Uncharacterized protein n=1 Tax=Brassica napus TaxID=3708 RepID=A0ABQ8C1E5_BRANA|nr:hypothetical protein HID58_033858 [Brassica napus]
MAAPLPPLKARNIRRGGDLMGVDILLLDSQFLVDLFDWGLLGGQECEEKSETEEDEELRLIKISKMECDRASGGRERQTAESNTALGSEQRSTRRRETKKAAESIEMDQVTERVRWTDMKQATDSVTRDRKCNCCSSIWHKGVSVPNIDGS